MMPFVTSATAAEAATDGPTFSDDLSSALVSDTATGGGVGVVSNHTMDNDYNAHDLLVQWLSAVVNGSTANSSTFDTDDSGFLYPLPLLISTTVCYVIIFIAGILGNVVTCIIINKNKSMHTATNYYLFNLAISDLLLLLSGMPMDLYNMWIPARYPFGTAVCMALGSISETTANATVLTITSFTVERYIAICHPFRQHMMDLSRAVKFIFAIWVVSFCLAIPQFIQVGVIEDRHSSVCTIKNKLIDHTFEVSSFVFFVGPMIVICALYVLIGLKLHSSKLLHGVVKRKGCTDPRGNGSSGGSGTGGNGGGGNSSGQARVIRMLVAVVVAFFLCWCPFHAQRLMAVNSAGSYVPSESFQWKIYTILNQFSGILYFLSTCINPLLYSIMSHKFREAFKTTIARQFYFGRHKPTEKYNYSVISRRGDPRPGQQHLHQQQQQQQRSHIRTPPNNSDVLRTPPIEQRVSLIENSKAYPVAGPRVSSDDRTREDVGRVVETSYHENGDLNAIRYDDVRRSSGCTATINSTPAGRIPTLIDTGVMMAKSGNTTHPAAVKKKGNLLSCFPHTKKTIFYFKSPKKETTKHVSGHSSTTRLNAPLTGNNNNSSSNWGGVLPRRLKKLDSVDSANTISNSSLQEVDEEEFNSSDLVKYMEEINQGIKS